MHRDHVQVADARRFVADEGQHPAIRGNLKSPIADAVACLCQPALFQCKAATGEATLSLLRGSIALPIGTMQLAAFAPAVFLVNPEGLTASAFYRRVASDGTETSGPLYQCSDQGFCQPLPATQSARGSFVTFYGTGFRNAGVSNVECYCMDFA